MKGTPAKDPRGGHIRLYWQIVDSPAWRTLTHADIRVYLALRRKLGKTNNGDINATLAEMRHAEIRSSSTLAAALHRLEELGFIAKTRQGGIANGGKLCCLYRFTDEPTFDIGKAGVRSGPATNDWQRFENKAQARNAVQPFFRKKRSKVRQAERTDAAIESEGKKTASTVEHEADSPVRTSKRAKTGPKALEPA
jgi:hypothetical protein